MNVVGVPDDSEVVSGGARVVAGISLVDGGEQVLMEAGLGCLGLLLVCVPDTQEGVGLGSRVVVRGSARVSVFRTLHRSDVASAHRSGSRSGLGLGTRLSSRERVLKEVCTCHRGRSGLWSGERALTAFRTLRMSSVAYVLSDVTSASLTFRTSWRSLLRASGSVRVVVQGAPVDGLLHGRRRSLYDVVCGGAPIVGGEHTLTGTASGLLATVGTLTVFRRDDGVVWCSIVDGMPYTSVGSCGAMRKGTSGLWSPGWALSGLCRERRTTCRGRRRVNTGRPSSGPVDGSANDRGVDGVGD